MLWALATIGLASDDSTTDVDPWTQDCASIGRRTFGMLAKVTDLQGNDADPLQHVMVHRQLPAASDGRFRMTARYARKAMNICEGDLIETWHDTRVVVYRTGGDRRSPTARILLEGGSLLKTDAPARQLKGFASYYLFDDAPSHDFEVLLGYSGQGACMPGSSFSVRILDPETGRAEVAVSPDNDAFNTAPTDHGISVCDEDGDVIGPRIHGGTAAEVGTDVTFLTDIRAEVAVGRTRELQAEGTSELKRLLKSPPAATAYARPASVKHQFIVQGVNPPDELRIDGDVVPHGGWIPLRDDGLGPALVTRKTIKLPPGRHRIEVGDADEVVQHDFSTGVDEQMVTVAIVRDGADTGAIPDHVSLSAGVGVESHSNAYLLPGANDPLSNLLLRPELDLGVGNSSVHFELDADAAARLALTQDNLHRFDLGQGTATLLLAPHGRVGARVLLEGWMRNEVARSFLTLNPRVAANTPYDTWNHLDGATDLVLRAGDAEVLVGGHAAFDDFRMPENATATVGRGFNQRTVLGPRLTARYQAGGRTTLFVEGAYDQNRWRDTWASVAPGSFAGTFVASPHSNYLRGFFGVGGHWLGPRWWFEGKVGYGSGQYDETTVLPSGTPPVSAAFAADVTAPIAAVTLRHEQFELGWRTDIEDAWFTNATRFHAIHSRFDVPLGRAGAFGRIEARPQEIHFGDVARTDSRWLSEAGARYKLTDHATIESAVRWQRRWSSDPDLDYGDVGLQVMVTVQ